MENANASSTIQPAKLGEYAYQLFCHLCTLWSGWASVG